MSVLEFESCYRNNTEIVDATISVRNNQGLVSLIQVFFFPSNFVKSILSEWLHRELSFCRNIQLRVKRLRESSSQSSDYFLRWTVKKFRLKSQGKRVCLQSFFSIKALQVDSSYFNLIFIHCNYMWKNKTTREGRMVSNFWEESFFLRISNFYCHFLLAYSTW